MDSIMAGLPALAFWGAVAVTFFSGFVKGTVGFAMPLIMISAFSAFLPPEIALAGLILPTLVTNISQAFRQGVAAALESARKYWRMITATVVFIIISAQFVRAIPQDLFLLLLGVPVTAYALLQLSGRSLALPLRNRRLAEWGLGIIGGLYGGISGVWGPPVLVYLLSVGAEKVESIRVSGVIFLIGAVVLFLAHLQTGVMNAQTVPFSAALILPGMAGLMLGYRVQDRMDQARFRWWTQVLLVLTGLNLMRRALGF
ncbi:sulfite exporter TauE/SafE family protein [Szabonella alba]|uniref:Probable membrane transporter protein n=1 Tax=Szabonella alba TaxID=2804194 RepID=A0A8K0VAD8_9RHOB|nr:sulfite exporter TauE/SafE family protein [Szabonella alba]MBL4918427.1 sulfite exporter TauE/SafE family protein [Szabonella alba]